MHTRLSALAWLLVAGLAHAQAPAVATPPTPSSPAAVASDPVPGPLPGGQAPVPATLTPAAVGPVAQPAPKPACSIAVLDLENGEGVSKERASALTDVVTQELMQRSGCSVLSRSDIRAMLSFEAEKQLMGCENDSCMAELGGALGVENLITGKISKINDSSLISLRETALKTSKVLRRATDSFTGEDDETIAFMAWLARKLVVDDPAIVGPRPTARPKVVAQSGVHVLQRQQSAWRTLAWTGVVLASITGVLTAGAATTTLVMSNTVKSGKEAAVTQGQQGTVQTLSELGPWFADGSNIGLYVTAGLLVPTIGLFFLPADDVADVTLSAGTTAKGTP